MTSHPDRTMHTFFCPRCRQNYERSDPGKCEVCGLTMVPAGYCPKCGGYWRMRVGQTCPDHDAVLQGEEAEVQQRLDDEARALDPGLDPAVVFEGPKMDCTLLQAALSDAGIEAEVQEPASDPLLARLEPVGVRVLVPRRQIEHAQDIVRDFQRPSE